MNLNNKQKRTLWRWVLTISLVLEVGLLLIVETTISSGNFQLSIFQSIAFAGIAIWIYIAYLKQRHIDMSKHAVSEKIKTHSLLHALKDGIIVLDSGNNILVMNSKASQITGLDEVASIGQSIWHKLDDRLKHVLSCEHDAEDEGTITSTGNSVRFNVMTFSHDTEDNNQKLVYVLPSQATTAQTPVQNQDMEDRTIELLSAITNELIVFLPSVEEQSVKESLCRLIARSTSEQCRLKCSNITPSIEANTLSESLVCEEVSLCDILKDSCTDHAVVISECDVKLDLPDESQNVLALSADKTLITTAVKQIISNALLESIPNGEISVKTAEMGENIGLAIIDKGHSISSDKSGQLFNKNYNGVDDSSGEKARSNGEGYFMARGIVEAHGGTLVAETVPDGGLRVTVMLSPASKHK